MDTNKITDPKDLFANIGNPPSKLYTAKDGESVAEAAAQSVVVKAESVKTALDEQQEMIDQTKVEIVQRTAAINNNQSLFNLQKVLDGWLFSPEEVKAAAGLILARKNTDLNIDTAASYGVVPDSVVATFVNSAATKATGEARLEVARVLDTATGITRSIADDKNVAAEEVAQKAQKLLKVWRDAEALSVMFNRLFKKTLNRVISYQDRLAVVGQDLAKKQVVLESISSSLVSRQALVRKCLYDTCISGMALESLLEREKQTLANLEAKKNEDQGAPQVLAQKIQEQEALVEIMTKRLVDQKAFAIKLIGLYSVIGNTRFNVAIIKADVVFTRTNLLATLGLQLGLVTDMISTLRISKAARDIREAEAAASEKVGVASEALNQAGNLALTEVETTIRSLKATVQAAVMGIENTHANMQRVEDMTSKADEEFGEMFKQLAG